MIWVWWCWNTWKLLESTPLLKPQYFGRKLTISIPFFETIHDYPIIIPLFYTIIIPWLYHYNPISYLKKCGVSFFLDLPWLSWSRMVEDREIEVEIVEMCLEGINPSEESDKVNDRSVLINPPFGHRKCNLFLVISGVDHYSGSMIHHYHVRCLVGCWSARSQRFGTS